MEIRGALESRIQPSSGDLHPREARNTGHPPGCDGVLQPTQRVGVKLRSVLWQYAVKTLAKPEVITRN